MKSMREKGNPKQNSVTERMIRTLKTQYLMSSQDIKKSMFIKNIEQFFQKRKSFIIIIKN